MDEAEEIIRCPRCGAEMKKNQRYCMKCGHLNYEHPDNQSMMQYVEKNPQEMSNQPFVVGQTGVSGTGERQAYADQAGRRKTCFIVNISLFFLLFASLTFFLLSKNNFDFMATIQDTFFAILLIVLPFMFLLYLSMQIVYMKTNRPWWSFYIPFYNCYVFFAITMKHGWYVFFLLIPVVNVFFILAGIYQLGVKFGKNGLLTVLFPWIMIPMIAFSETVKYQGISYVEASTDLSSDGGQKISVAESHYKQNQKLIGVSVFLIFLGVGSLLFVNYDKISNYINNYRNEKFIDRVQDVLTAAKKSIEVDSYECDDGNFVSSLNYTYYITFSNPSKFFDTKVNSSNLTGEEFRGYIKVVNQLDSSVISISISDGEQGVQDAIDGQLAVSSIQELSRLEYPLNAIFCKKI